MSDLRVVGSLHTCDLVLVTLAHVARLTINASRKHYHRVGRRLNRLTASSRELSAIVNILKFCPINQLCRASFRRLASEHALHNRIVSAHLVAHECERVCELQLLKLFVDGRGRIKRKLKRSAARVRKFRKTLRVRLLAFFRKSHQRARNTEKLSADACCQVKKSSLLRVSCEVMMSFSDCVPGVAVFCLLLRVCGDCFAQSFFLLTLSFNERLILQALKLAAID